MARDLERVIEAVENFGLLLMTDARLPSVAGLVAGVSVRGSWWSHPKSHAIFAVLVVMDHRPDLLAAKLVSGKVTFVHRSLWPAMLGVAGAREPWQTQGLSREARALWTEVERQGEMRADGIPGLVIRELESSLLVHSQEFHTETGAHGKILRTWENWSRQAGFHGKLLAPDQGRAALENAVERLNREFEAKGSLPWSRKPAGRAKRPIGHN